MKFKIMALCATIALGGCMSVSGIKATRITGKEICIIDNPQVRSEFRDAYERQLQARGYTTKIIYNPNDCKITSTFSATYRWAWQIYLSTAELKLFDNGVEIGRVAYHVPSASLEKHGTVEGKIESMVAQLLP